MRVSVFGAGYVGLVTSAGLAELGHEVVCVDVDESKVAALSSGIAPIHEPGLQELLVRTVGARLTATTDAGSAVLGSELTIVAVGTPQRNGEQNLDALRSATATIADAVAGKDGYHVVVVKSTVLPGTTGGPVREILAERSGREVGRELGLGMSPEFLTEGQAVADFFSPDRIVLGGIDSETHSALEALHAPLPASIPRLRTNLATAEMIKYISNALLATSISFANEMANLCARLDDVDAVDVQRGLHLARTLTPIGVDGEGVRAPLASYLEAGTGFGGSCLPKDTSALAAFGEQVGTSMRMLRAVLETNAHQPDELVRIVAEGLGSIDGARITVLGLAFKPDTDDVRETPAVPVVERLVARGADVTVHDPVVDRLPDALARLPRVALVSDLGDALRGADAVVIVTRWQEYEALPDALAGVDQPPLVVDGRRMLAADRLERYAGIGR
jgi:UDPglucose 6-dehydrogenase/GDP-mannose 6-dehydrogenase